VLLYDLSDPDAPRRAARVELPGSAWSWGLRAEQGLLWLTHGEWATQRPEEGIRYWLDRIDASDPDAPLRLPKVNVPGVFLGAARGGSRVHTLETRWDASSQKATSWLHALDLTARGTARLAASVALPGWVAGAVIEGSSAWAVTQEWSSSRSETRLAAVDLAGMRLASSQDLEASWAWPMRATGGKLFLAASATAGQTVLVYGLATPGRPTFEQAAPNPGWAWDVVVDGGVAYLPSGPYGVPMIRLSP
jgi:hypothetical protein